MAFTKSIIFWEHSESNNDVPGNPSVLRKIANNLNSAENYISTIFEDEVKEESPVVGVIKSYKKMELDCVMSESHGFNNEVTSYPISTGFNISEHTIRKNYTFRISGLVTNITMPDNVLTFNTIGKVAGSMYSRSNNIVIGSLLGSAGNMLDNSLISGNPIKDRFEEIKNLVTNGTLVHVSTILGTYENCVIRSASITQNVQTSSVMPVDLAFEQMRVIDDSGVEGAVSQSVQTEMEKVKNEKTGNFLDDMFSMLKKQGVNIYREWL